VVIARRRGPDAADDDGWWDLGHRGGWVESAEVVDHVVSWERIAPTNLLDPDTEAGPDEPER
jgi:hypothetical protein